MNPTDLLTAPTLIKKCAQTKIVFPPDIKPTTLCIVGESLGSEEELHDEYFIGKAGRLLDKLLKEVGLIRQIIHITNVVKVKIPSTPDKEKYLNSINLSIQDFIPYLKEELDHVNPMIILALGKIALETLTGQTEIGKYRGSVLPCILTSNPIPVLATYHPSYLARGQMQLYPYVRFDVKRFAERAFDIESEDSSYEQIIDPSLTQVLDFLHDIHQNSTSTCFDIETVAKQRITCIGWTKNPNSAICIPFRHNGLKNRWQKHEQIIILNAMKELYARPGLIKIAQNMHYDMHFLLPLLGFPREPLFDTMYAHALIHPDARHDLGFLTSIYTKMAFHKDEAKDWEEKKLPHDQTLWEYNIKDVITTHRVYEKEKKDLKELDLYNFFTGYIMPFRRVLFEMECKGMNINVQEKDAWTKFVEEEELPIALDILHKMTDRELNPNSSKQVGEYLESLGLSVPRTEKGNYTVKEDKLEALVARYPNYKQVLKQILCTRVLKAKDLGTYLKAKVSPDGRMRTSYGTDKTGRLSSKANHQDEGCLLPETEVLTPIGWKRLDELNDVEHILQWEPTTQQLTFDKATLYTRDAENETMILAESDFHRNGYTFGHRIPQFTTKKRYIETDAQHLTTINTRIPIAGKYVGGVIDIPFIRLAEAVRADGSIEESGAIRFSVKKQHKVNRLKLLCKELNITLNKQNYKRLGYQRFAISKEQSEFIVNFWHDHNFSIGKWVLNLNPETLHALVDETKYWDSHIRGKSWVFTTTSKRTAHWLQTAAHLISFSASIAVREDNSRGYGGKNNLPLWIVAIKPRHYTYSEPKHFSHFKHTGQVYCVETKTTFFLCKHANRICITGNTNIQNQPKKFRTYYIPDKGHVLLTPDLAQAEAFVFVYQAHAEKLKQRMLKGEKIHAVVANWVHNKPIKELTSDQYRDVKAVVYSSTYGVGINTLATIMERTVAEAKVIKQKYNDIVPEVLEYQNAIDKQVNDTRLMVNPYGRRRIFTGFINDTTLRSAYSQLPQSTVADTIDIGILGLWLIKPPDIYIVAQVHDEAVISLPLEKVATFTPYIKAHLETLREIEIEGEILVIPCEIGNIKHNWKGD